MMCTRYSWVSGIFSITDKVLATTLTVFRNRLLPYSGGGFFIAVNRAIVNGIRI
jgi:hypothetical protein